MSTLIFLLATLQAAYAGDAKYPAEVDPTLAYAQAYIESDLDPCAVSRVVHHHRVSGHYPCQKPFPPSWRGPYFCGLWMTEAYTEQSCRAMQEPFAAWEVRRGEFRAWLDAAHGNVRRALAGYGCGFWGMSHPGRCGSGAPYADRVIRLSRGKKWKKLKNLS